MVGRSRQQDKKNTDINEQLESLKQTILKEFKDLLAFAMQNKIPVNPQVTQAIKELTDEPIYIPSQITSDTDQEITIKEEETDDTTLGDAAEALRRAKKEKKPND